MRKLFSLAPLFLAAGLIGCSHPQPVYAPPPPPALDYQAMEQQGQHDGFDAARSDVQAGRPPVFDHHPRYRNPPVPPPGIAAYRQGFRRGYEQFLHQAPPPR
jgi:hypothetical protein